MRTPNKVARLKKVFERQTPVDKQKAVTTKEMVKKKEKGAAARQLLIGQNLRNVLPTTSEDEVTPVERPKRSPKKAATVAAGKGGPCLAAVAGVGPPSAATAQVAAAKETKPAQKRTREEESPVKQAKKADIMGDVEARMAAIQKILEEGGAGHLFQAVKDQFVQIIEEIFEKQVNKMKAAATEEARRERELERCSRSIIVHNADKMVAEDREEMERTGINYSLAEMVTEMLHMQCRSMISIQEAYSMGTRATGGLQLQYAWFWGQEPRREWYLKPLLAT